MQIKESRISIRNQIIHLVDIHCPQLVVPKTSHEYVVVQTKAIVPGFYKDAIRIELKSKLFDRGQYDEIDIYVLDDQYFEASRKIAEDYEKLSAKEANIIKMF